MDKEKLNKAIILRSMLDTDLNAVSRVLDIKGRCTKWKLKCINEVKREHRRMLLEEWQHFNGTILAH